MESLESESSHYDVIIVGAGISGVVSLKTCKEAGMKCILLEATDQIGGLWTFRKDSDYGAMSFTHINVSKAQNSFNEASIKEQKVPISNS